MIGIRVEGDIEAVADKLEAMAEVDYVVITRRLSSTSSSRSSARTTTTCSSSSASASGRSRASCTPRPSST